MTSLRFEYITHEAVTASFIFIISKMEAPKYWNLPWISRHRLKEWPQQHYKYHIVDNEEGEDTIIIYTLSTILDRETNYELNF